VSRSTRDVVVILLAGAVAVSLVVVSVGIIAIRLHEPGVNLSAPAGAVGGLITTGFGAVVGYVIGRRNGGAHDG
jgi:hypothetical protein